MKKLYRIKSERKISGLCAGIAAYTEIDVTVIRLSAFLFILLTGIFPGAFLYLVATLITPEKG